LSLGNLVKSKVPIIIILILLFYVVFLLYADINKITEEFSKIKFEYIFAVLVIESLSLTIRGFRQLHLLKKIGINISLKDNFIIYLAGMAMIITPLGSGELIKSHYIKQKYQEPISKTAPLVLVERYHDFLATTTILLIITSIVFLWQSALIIGISSGLLISIYIIARNRILLNKFLKKIVKIRFFEKITPDLEFSESLSKLTSPKITLDVWLISILAFFIDAGAVYVAFLAFNQDLGFLLTTQIYFTSIVSGALSFLPAGIGVTEGSFVSLLMLQNIDFSLASSLVLFSRLTTIWFATILGFIATRFVLKKNN